jgi:hypothetical protein
MVAGAARLKAQASGALRRAAMASGGGSGGGAAAPAAGGAALLADLAASAAAAAPRVRPHVRRTPLERSPWLSAAAGCDAYLKLESEQARGEVGGGRGAAAQPGRACTSPLPPLKRAARLGAESSPRPPHAPP